MGADVSVVRRLTGALAAIGVVALGLGAATASAADPPRPVAVQAKPGKVGSAARALAAGGLRVQRRAGGRLQVAASPSRLRSLERLAPVASANLEATGFADEIVRSQGIDRSGAGVFLPALTRLPPGAESSDSEDITIAVLDLGFGRNISARQAAGELPPAERLEIRAFDPSVGIEGRNAYGHATNHGELVAQTVYDYAPNARYIFASYQTPLDFVAAVDWLIDRRVDIVVHSNSFIEGPFDGTSPAARAVDRAAQAGIAWFNSAGNYGLRHWSGGWNDHDGDGTQDWPLPQGWSFFRAAGRPITFALSWSRPQGAGEAPVDLDIVLERLGEGNTWSPVASSQDRQSAGAPLSERITGYESPTDGFFRLTVRHVSGPLPDRLTLFSREVPLAAIGGSPEGSSPTPGDARGAISVGAVDWRGDAPKRYSSQGPTWDGRLKPDIVASTDTRVSAGERARSVGGTSNSAPNAAGAAAVLLGVLKRQGVPITHGLLRGLLVSQALDLGEPGPDNAYGAGRVRVYARPPKVVRAKPKPLEAVRRVVKLEFRPVSKARLTRWTLAVDGTQIGGRRKLDKPAARIDTRRLDDGWHLIRIQAADWPGNVGTRELAIRVDNTPPVVALGRPRRGPVSGRVGGKPARAVTLPIRVDDEGTAGRLRATLTVSRGGSTIKTRRLALRAGRGKAVGIGRLAEGGYTVALTVEDRAGNQRSAVRSVRVT